MNTKQEFIEAVKIGHEIEFSYCGQHYFESRRSDTDWYIYHEETKEEQHFLTADDMLKSTVLLGSNINEVWDQITLDFIL